MGRLHTMNRFVLITGASSGIGRATAVRLAAEGKHLILVARRKDKLDELASELKGKGKKAGMNVQVYALDVTDRKAVQTLFESLKKDELEAVINNAGAALGRDPLETASDDDLQGMIDLNISAFLQVAKLSIPFLRKTRGHLVNMGSIAGLEVYENGTTYCGTKHFVHAISKGLRQELLGSGVRVTTIAPGAVETEFSVVRFHGDAAKAKAMYQGFEPLRGEDIADAVWFALSRPPHVNIDQLTILATAQASATKIAKTGKK